MCFHKLMNIRLLNALSILLIFLLASCAYQNQKKSTYTINCKATDSVGEIMSIALENYFKNKKGAMISIGGKFYRWPTTLDMSPPIPTFIDNFGVYSFRDKYEVIYPNSKIETNQNIVIVLKHDDSILDYLKIINRIGINSKFGLIVMNKGLNYSNPNLEELEEKNTLTK